MKFGTNIVFCIPTTSKSKRSPEWIDSLYGLQLPLGSGSARIWTYDISIAEARNSLVQQAFQYNPNYIVFIGDDVLFPPNAVMSMLDKIGKTYNGIKCDMVTGVYWTKSFPSEPYLWQMGMEGPFKDWKAGDFFSIDMAGCDCLVVDINVFKEIPFPWFSLDWKWDKKDQLNLSTEDFYFYTKARKHGFRLWADTSIQCYHEDRAKPQMFGLTTDMPQATGIQELQEWKDKGQKTAADLGAGLWSPQWPDNIKLVRFDARKDINIDVCCDIANIPSMFFDKFDIVHSSHVLEHFPRGDSLKLIRHWCHLLKPGGTFIIRVPNIGYAIQTILDSQNNPGTISASAQTYAWGQVYGDQQSAYDTSFHKTGFTKPKLEKLMAAATWLSNVTIKETEDGANFWVEGIMTGNPSTIETIGDWWEEIYKKENIIPSDRILKTPTDVDKNIPVQEDNTAGPLAAFKELDKPLEIIENAKVEMNLKYKQAVLEGID
jgi:predicted SAM-dependent methyltransferase